MAEEVIDYRCPTCNSDNLEWYSGKPGVHIHLNGLDSGRCINCGEAFVIPMEEEE